ncbi:hypothetical protein PC128_g11004 [Phytophthora cactorum]|nr:hypothetical protein PC128_g11004 [Phytophthora cactorum]
MLSTNADCNSTVKSSEFSLNQGRSKCLSVSYLFLVVRRNLRGRKSLKKTKLPGSSGLEKSGGSASGSGFSRRCGVSKILTLLRQPSQTRCSEHSMT